MLIMRKFDFIPIIHRIFDGLFVLILKLFSKYPFKLQNFHLNPKDISFSFLLYISFKFSLIFFFKTF